MNRIYQGRVSAVEIADSEGEWQKLNDWKSVLWRHHELFQDAVNYYVIALLALSGEHNERFLSTRQRLAQVDEDGRPTEHHVWTQVRRRGVTRRGMCGSVAPYLDLNPSNATPEDCFRAVLAGNVLEPELLDLALRELLTECKGDSAIQQKGREMLPRFCDAAYGGGFPHSDTARAKSAAKDHLPRLLHSPEVAGHIRGLPQELDFAYFANSNHNAKPFSGDTAKAKLKEALDFVAERCTEIEQMKGVLLNKIHDLPSNITFPAYRGGSINKDALKFRFFAYLLFVHVEQNEATFAALRNAFPKPREKKTRHARGEGADVPDFRKFGDDPIKLARGVRGYVFPAFTSLTCWGAEDLEPVWKEFDIAAFKEALKALHQMEVKGEERRKEREKLEDRLACMKGEKKWKASGEVEEEPPTLVKGDPRVERLEGILATDLAQEYELAEGQSVAYGLNPRTIRGFRDLRTAWNRIAPEGVEPSKKLGERLTDALRSYQRENAYFVGSVRLFEELLKPRNWVVWQEPSMETKAAWRKAAKLTGDADFAEDPLAALTQMRQMEKKIEALKEPIRFTPADPQYSRRQFYFSDVCKFTDRGEYRHESNSRSVVVPLAVKRNGVFRKCRARLQYSAPRLFRDNLRSDSDENTKSAPFLQPMMEALGFSTEMPQNMSRCPVALMPEVLPDGDKRVLLNFPVALDTDFLIGQLGLRRNWEKQFANFDKKNFYLRWPTLTDGVKARPARWWWEEVDSFLCMSVDLGQRDAGAFAVLDVRANHNFGRKPARELGVTGDKKWRAAVAEMGLLRLPGEDAKVFRDGRLGTEFYGERGRSADPWEWEEALDIARRLCPDIDPLDFVGRTQNHYSFPQQNDGLLRCLRVAQGRLARLQSLSWQLLDNDRAAAAASDMEMNEEYKPLLAPLPEPRTPAVVAKAVNARAIELRKVLEIALVHIANRVLPLRDRNWEWVKRPDKSGCHVLRQTSRSSARNERKVIGQRGLSLERIRQLEELRRRAQSLNRALMQEPGVKPMLGRATRGVELPDPCPEILEKLDRIKEQRVNQTAHLILARALGLRLRAPIKERPERIAKDIHGEYEVFRQPVGFIVLEDLARYLSSQGRAPAENSRLMQWCHRALLHKLKELCEPYGIPVVEVSAAYSSRFCSRTGVAGFRAVDLTPGSKTDWHWQRELAQLERHERGEVTLDSSHLTRLRHIKKLFDVLRDVNAVRMGEKPRALMAPIPGGPIFVPANGRAIQADINAAINIGLRAIAAPDCHAIHARIRSKHKDGQFLVRVETKRESARWQGEVVQIELESISDGKSLSTSRNPNFFFDAARVANYDRASVGPFALPVASGRGVWGTLRQTEWRVVNRLNNERLAKWGFGRPLDEGGVGVADAGTPIEEDDVLA